MKMVLFLWKSIFILIILGQNNFFVKNIKGRKIKAKEDVLEKSEQNLSCLKCKKLLMKYLLIKWNYRDTTLITTIQVLFKKSFKI